MRLPVNILEAVKASTGTVFLAIANVVLLGALLAVLLNGTQATDILSKPGKTAVAEAIGFEAPALRSDFEVIQAQPVFHTSRSFYVPPEPVAVETVVMPPDHRIAGAMSLPEGKTIAFLVHNQTGMRTKVQKGDVLEGWSIEEVAPQRVVLSMNGQRRELTAAKPSGAAPPGMQAMSTMTQPPNGAQGGLRVLSGGPSGYPNSTSSQLPPSPPGGVGARLYRPPPGQ